MQCNNFSTQETLKVLIAIYFLEARFKPPRFLGQKLGA
jgi:hypothetical protein